MPDNSVVTVHGQPIAIECHLGQTFEQGDIDPDEVVAPWDDTVSTDGLEHSPKPPDKGDWADLWVGGLCLVDSDSHRACFVTGEYWGWEGAAPVTQFDFSKVVSVTAPEGAIMAMNYERPRPEARYAPPPVTVKQQLGNTPTLDEKQLNWVKQQNTQKSTFQVTLPAPVPSVCLSLAVGLKGPTVCYGVGGGPVGDGMAKKAKSIAARDGAVAYIYAGTYGDFTGSIVWSDIADLNDQAFGDDTWTEAIAAMAILRVQDVPPEVVRPEAQAANGGAA